MNVLKFCTFFSFCFLAGCSVIGNVTKTSLIKSAETYSDMSPAHKEEMKLSTKQNFFSAQLLTSNIEDWLIKVVTYGALEEIQSGISIDLTLATDDKYYRELEQPELIDVNLQGELVEYTYQFTRKNQWLWQFYQQQLFDLEKPDFNFLLQPNISNQNKVSHLEYHFAPDFGFLTLAQFMRYFWVVSDTRWQEFCESDEYRFDKVEACGQVTITETD